MLVPAFALSSLVIAAACALSVATLYVIRRGIALNISTQGGLIWLRLLDGTRWFFQILCTWFALSAFAPLQIVFFFVAVMLFLQVYAAIFAAARERQALGLLLVQVHNARGSVPDLLEAYGQANPNRLGAQARLTGEAIRRGENLLSASRRLHFQLPTPTRLALDSPASKHTMGLLEASMVSKDPTNISRVAIVGAYLPFLLIFMAIVLAFMSFAIIPTFDEMFEEFELVSNGLIMLDWIAFFLLPLIVYSVLLTGLYIGIVFFLWAIGFQGALRALPVFGSLILQNRQATLLDSLAFATEQQKSLPDAFREIGNATVYRSEQRTLGICVADIQLGKPMKSALCRIVNPKQATWLVAASQTNHLPETFRNLADLIRMRLSRRLEWTVSVAMPIIIVLCAIPVLLICYAIIQSLTDLILGLK